MQYELNHGRLKLLKWIAGLPLFSLIACFVVDKLVQHRKSDATLRRQFRRKHIPATVHYFTANGRKLRYVSVGNDSLPALFFLHGSPGSLSFYDALFTDPLLLQTFKMYAVDRPGYGYAGLGDPEPSIQQQADMIRQIINSLHSVRHPVIIVAYSYGAAIACRLLMDHPAIADGLLLLAPAIQPGKEKYFWFTPLIEKPFIRQIIPRLFRSANTEKFHHAAELTKMLPYWNRIQVPVLYVQGEKDQWAYTSNADFAKSNLTNVPWLRIEMLKDRGHFFTYTEKEIIRQKVLELYNHIISHRK
jgi:pimeloyl-ACP methyl ester carboxylesterase